VLLQLLADHLQLRRLGEPLVVVQRFPRREEVEVLAGDLQECRGVGGVEQAIRNLTYGDWVTHVTDQASKDGVTGTPTVLVAGKELADLSPDGLTAAVEAAQAG